MIKVKIIVVDRTRADFLRTGEAFYMNRLKRYTDLRWVEVKPTKIIKGVPDAEVLCKEAAAITKRVHPRDYLIALDRKGSAYDSEGFARHLEKLSLSRDRLAFIIGGPLGLSQHLLGQAGEIFSLSRLTLTHEMTRLFFLEQLYRAFTIIHHEKYHK